MRTKEDLQILQLLEKESIESFIEDRGNIREGAKKNILKIQVENRQSYNKKRKKARQYKVGDLVVIQRPSLGLGLRMRPKFFCSYGGVKVKLKDRYDVKKVGQHEGPTVTITAADRMKMLNRTQIHCIYFLYTLPVSFHFIHFRFFLYKCFLLYKSLV
ncbi:hypothetical protein AVEN_226395-1 [Araneus ventricosus]|uniref:Uncharacterized protein n=1 Tax=Araneus ventricosus TaxID=182803 RepID=A0A4Y2IJU5_ARAVE|nr:hypothetical protein AVEN_226395-1 [Araneus ventricosus]